MKTIEVADSDDEDLPIGAAGLHVKPAAAATQDSMAANTANQFADWSAVRATAAANQDGEEIKGQLD